MSGVLPPAAAKAYQKQVARDVGWISDVLQRHGLALTVVNQRIAPRARSLEETLARGLLYRRLQYYGLMPPSSGEQRKRKR